MQLSKIIAIVFISGFFAFLLSCGDPDISPDMLDGEVIFDASLYNPEAFLVSYSNPNPTPEEADMPVIIVSHGYSASTFEWNEFYPQSDFGESTSRNVQLTILGYSEN